MDSLPVTLIVKAPNQQIEDQTVKCELSWTINKLKQHLSEVYPSKPPSHEQKLIYSGQLLNDTVVLGDILRQYDGQDTHTVHLVCTPNLSTTTVTANTSNVPPQLRQRQSTTSSGPSSSMPNITIPANVTATSVNANPNVPHDMCAQYILMQQAYLQYMSHYMNLYASAANQNVDAANLAPQAQPVINQQPVNGDLANANNVVQPQQNALAAQNAAPANGEPEEERELLDVIYTVLRIILFSAILFYYSTPLRYLFVLFLVVCLYIYRMGFFRIVNVNNNNIVQGEPAVEEAPTRLMVAWTFFTTFFASLIPEIPNVV
ncbi:homocysteine-responsive endoplasmic reticulum-resident ubiquitin-like domain member 2 protein [Onthophagus taurus]|uniref:homocysteine-responsive endoplasmic reticulum-resident ubiquitin-like domain member 2 protein n=1 Tax=Onthophagus taurus TaxID=166361 RepID=UPI000C20F5FB|nr:homocysteine-responsive endoplasmic reticulum-resident ubiquitin-like domain member 2 protein [Onthophagus taurus]